MAKKNQSRKASETEWEINKKVADQTFWVEQVKKNPEEFKYYLEDKIIKSAHHKDILNSSKYFSKFFNKIFPKIYPGKS